MVRFLRSIWVQDPGTETSPESVSVDSLSWIHINSETKPWLLQSHYGPVPKVGWIVIRSVGGVHCVDVTVQLVSEGQPGFGGEVAGAPAEGPGAFTVPGGGGGQTRLHLLDGNWGGQKVRGQRSGSVFLSVNHWWVQLSLTGVWRTLSALTAFLTASVEGKTLEHLHTHRTGNCWTKTVKKIPTKYSFSHNSGFLLFFKTFLNEFKVLDVCSLRHLTLDTKMWILRIPACLFRLVQTPVAASPLIWSQTELGFMSRIQA